MSQASNANAAVNSERILSADVREAFAAFEQPDRLAQWWGPNGFTNTFELFEFKPGGRWKYVMHGPKGAQFQNESVFLELDEPSVVVIHHISKPRYVLRVTFAARPEGTEIEWSQQFEDPAVAESIGHIVEPAIEQFLNRLQAVLEWSPAP